MMQITTLECQYYFILNEFRGDTILCSRRAPANRRKLGQKPRSTVIYNFHVKIDTQEIINLCIEMGSNQDCWLEALTNYINDLTIEMRYDLMLVSSPELNGLN